MYRWRFAVLYVLLAAVLYGGAFAAGASWGSHDTTRTVRVERARISPTATYAEVVANFAGAPYVNGTLTELPGFQCSGWTFGSAATDSGWVVIRCRK